MVRHMAALLLLAAFAGANAATYQEAFEAMSNDVANPGKSFAFVKAAIREGDLPGAVAALERILRVNPTLANIQLELGVLYLRLGSPEVAKAHISESLESPDVPVWVRNRAKNLLAHADREASRHQWSFAVGSSARYDDNANAAPVDREVLVGGAVGLLDEDDTGRKDSSWDLSTSTQYTYAFNSESGNQLETLLQTYHRRYDDSDEIDVDSVTLLVGPRFNFGPVLNPSSSLQPYLLGTRLDLAGDKYLERVGGGLNYRRIFSPSLQGDFYVEYLDQDYFDTDLRNASDRSGDEYQLRGVLSYLIDPGKLLSFGVSGGQRNAEVPWERRDEFGFRLAYTHALMFGGARPWRLTLGFGAARLDYDAGDPAIDVTRARKDDRLSASVALSVPLARRLNLTLGTSYADVDSSLPNFEYDNWGARLGLLLAF